MVILGEVTPGMEDSPFSTGYVDFYSSMIKVPFLGDYFSRIMPVFILLFGSVFAALSLGKLRSKTLTAIKNFTKKNMEGTGSGLKTDVMKAVKEVKSVEEQNIVQRILKGERAILQEFDLLNKKQERNKLTRFNEPAIGSKQQIEMAAAAKPKTID